MNPRETTRRLCNDTLEQAAEWVVRLNDPQASEADFAEWQQWLAQAPGNSQAFHEVQSAWQRSSAVVSVIAAPKSNARAVMRAPTRAWSMPRWMWPLSLAASVLVVCSIILLHVMPITLSTSTGELRSVKLPDGSRVSLGPETQLRLSFSERERLLSMQSGEAFFEVARDPRRPFSVRTPAGTVVAVGTAFSVHAVTVTHGKVRVETGIPPASVAGAGPAEATVSSQSVVLGTGQRLVRERERTQISALPSVDSVTAWQQRRLEYNNEELRVVVADINRYSAAKLLIEDSAIGEQRYTGTVFPDEIDLWLASIEGVFQIRVSQKGRHRVISPRD
jgi:transmembrane sensor